MSKTPWYYALRYYWWCVRNRRWRLIVHYHHAQTDAYGLAYLWGAPRPRP